MAKGDIRVVFYDPSNMTVRDMGSQGYLRGVSAMGKGYAGKVGNGQVDISISELALLDGAYTYIHAFDICVVYLVNGGNNERICSFVVRNVKLQTSAYGRAAFFKLSGPDMLYYLGRKVNTINIGLKHSGLAMATQIDRQFVLVPHGNLEDEGYTQAESGGGDPTEWPVFWPKWTLIKSFDCGDGTNDVQVPKTWEDAKPGLGHEKWAAGDNITLAWQFTDIESTKSSISSITDEGTYYEFLLNESLNHSVDRKDSGTRYYPIFQPHVFKGDPIRIKMSDGEWHYSRVIGEVEFELIQFEEPLPVAVLDYADVEWWSHREPNVTNDIEDIMLPATDDDWTLSGTVSSEGSSHLVEMNTTLSLLEATAKATGDYFYPQQAVATVAEKTLVWKTSSPSTGLTLKRTTAQGSAATDVASATTALVHSLSRDTKDFPISTVIPIAGPDYSEVGNTWNLGDCDEGPAAGLFRLFGIFWDAPDNPTHDLNTEYVNGVWQVRNGLSTANATEKIDYPHIEPKNDSYSSRVEAANRLQAEAALTLFNRQATRYEYIAKTVLPDGVEINQGETVVLDVTEGEWDINSITLYIAEYEHSVKGSGKMRGVRETKLILSTVGPFTRLTGATVVANAIRSGLGGGPTTISGRGGGLAGTAPTGGVDPTAHLAVTIDSSTPTGALTIDGQALALEINHGNGLDVSGNDITMTVPTTDLSVASTNAVAAGGHTHAVVTTSDADGNHSEIIAGDSSGRVQLAGLGIKTAPNGDHLTMDTNSDIEGESFTSGFLGSQFGIDTGIGHIDARSAYFDELRVTLFTAEETLVTAGTHWVTPSMGKTSRDFVIPAVSSSDTLYIHDSEALPDTAKFRENDYLMIQVRDDTGVGLTYALVWGQVTSYGDESGGEQSWTFTTRSVGASFVGDTIPAEAVALDFGQSGQGWAATTTNDLAGSPYFKIATWVDNPYTAANRTEHVRLGNLNGLAGLGEEWGLFVGASITGPRAIISDTRFELHDVDFSMYAGTPDVSAAIRLHAIEFNTDVTAAIAPNGDTFAAGSYGVTRSAGTSDYYAYVDNSPSGGQPDGDYLYNTDDGEGRRWFDLESIDDALTEMSVVVYCVPVSFTDDLCSLRVQVFKSDSSTPLTNEVQAFNQDTPEGMYTAYFSDVDTTATQVEWDAARCRVRWVYQVASTSDADKFLTIDNDEGLVLTSGEDATLLTDRGYSFDYLGNDMGGVWSYALSGDNYLSLNAKNVTSAESHLRLIATGGTSADASIFIDAAANNDNGTAATILLDTADNEISMITGLVSVSNDLLVSSGITVGGTATASPATGQLILDQDALDGVILSARSDDVTGMATQGMDDDNEYFHVRKGDGATGGAAVKGAGESTRGMWVIGSANTADATETTSSQAPLILRGQVGNAAVGAGNNAVAMQSGSTTIWLIKNDGTMHMANAHSTTYFDEHDDVALIRSMTRPDALGYIQSKWDTFLTRNDEGLKALNVISEDGDFVNAQGIMKLQNGAIWQLYERIAELEAQIGNIH